MKSSIPLLRWILAGSCASLLAGVCAATVSGFNLGIAAPAPRQTLAALGQTLPITAQTQVGNQIIRLEVAQTPEQKSLGLMYRSALAADQGMLFPFEPAQVVNFWMRNVSISLDMVFLYQGQVKAIAANVPPCQQPSCPTYGPSGLVDQVVELRGGRAAELGLQVGDRLPIEFLPLGNTPAGQ
ncbi:hypothetical protein DO97_12935 [Neosynechococcus sphagnicola sy1]|uniref:DUF192 domain-containing protein n=1 Tax=Neosynechococcus sphagnicola sy1 TaxID=1497020 RepID=A0A098TN05_9CYAN|nr:DUF192 domain-containing protein [Neosynechococcus sphagnicola]KGF73715.1 hypothetical protein DO97_12935 [Neosynechococcus sphagnicola sy1]